MLALLWKDLLVELRTKETLASLFLLGTLLLLVLSFAFDPTHPLREKSAPGVLWVAIIFSGTSAINRSLLRERENDCFSGLLVAPIDRGTIFLAKTIVNLALLLIAEAFLIPLFIFFFNLPFLVTFGRLALVAPLATLGFAAIGTLFSAISLRTRAREIMLPLLMLPLATPLFLAAVETTGVLMEGGSVSQVSHWFKLTLTFDVVFLVVGWLTFEYAVAD
jgi:heme exporter protein B